MARKWRRGAYLMTTDKARLDLEMVHGFLKTSYWAAGISADVVMRSVKNSLAFGLFRGDEQVGCARVVTDYATFAYLADVFVLPGHRGRGLGRRLVRAMVEDGPGRDFRWLLHTADAHGLYAGFGFAAPDETLMERPHVTARRQPSAGVDVPG